MVFRLAVFILFFAPVFGVVGYLSFKKKFIERNKRKSPITNELLRSPGSHLRETISDLNWDISEGVSLLFAIPVFSIAYIYATALDKGVFDLPTLSVFAVIVTIFSLWQGRGLVQKINKRRAYSLGLDAELAVAQELDQLMLDGYRVFHDFPADKFNIDHIVIGINGVFAIETKGRTKPVSKDGHVDWKVKYDGKNLIFPGWQESNPLDQAKRQSEWLAKWLSGAVGEMVRVHPILMLPGWYIERTTSTGIPVLNGKNSRKLMPSLTGFELSEKEIIQIAFQIEQKCRDVKPSAYHESSK